MRIKTLITATPLISCLVLSGCVIHVDGSGGWQGSGATSIFGDLEVGEGKTVKDVNSVNGDIALKNNVTANTVDTVNGDIRIGDNVSVGAFDTVNGDIQGGENLTVRNNISTVNGDIRFDKGTRIEGSLDTVNGDIKFNQTTLVEDINSVNGDIVLRNNSVVEGDIVFKRKKSKSYNPTPKLVIDESSTVNGAIIIYSDVDLKIANESLRDKVEYRDRS